MAKSYSLIMFAAAGVLLPTGMAAQTSTPLTAQPQLLQFPSVAVGAQTAPQRITLINLVAIPVSLTSVTTPVGFTMSSNKCSGNVVPANGSCAISFVFKPQTARFFNDTITIGWSAGSIDVAAVASSFSGRLRVTVTGTSLADSDGDGLPDEWERGPVTIQNETINLAAMGATVGRKDVFVELDYLESPSHSHKPKVEAINKIVDAYWKRGIALHVDCGPDCIMNPDPSHRSFWGSLSRSNAVPHKDPVTNDINQLGSVVSGTNYSWASFDKIKSQYLTRSRSVVFRYGVFAHNIAGMPTSTGLARTQLQGDRKTTSDFIVSLGTTVNQVGNVMEQAGTFMHELGHNLGLTHGGCVSGTPVRCEESTYKPNYLSVMNYLFQTRGLLLNGSDGVMDYAATAFPNLDETRLTEKAGLGGTVAVGTRYWCPNGTERPVSPANVNVDWNCDNNLSLGVVAANIDGQAGSQLLNGGSDWPFLVFSGGSIGQAGAPPPLPSVTPIEELTTVEDLKITTIHGVSITEDNSLTVFPGTSANVTFIVQNRGSSADTFTLTFTPTRSIASWVHLAGLPPRVTLPRGGRQTFTVSVTAPSAGGFGEFALRAGSVSNSAVFDVGRIEITSGITDVAISVADTPDPVMAGNRLTYDAVVQNVSQEEARNVQVTADLPTLASVTTSGAPCLGTVHVTCTLDNLTAGEQMSFRITGIPQAVGIAQATFRATTTTSDTNNANNVVYTRTVVADQLPAPAQISPPDGAVFDIYPRTTLLRWAPVTAAASYGVEIDCFHCCTAGYWCTDVGKAWQIVNNLSGTTYTFDFVGAQPGRWRVWAVDAKGRRGAVSGWRVFRYLR